MEFIVGYPKGSPLVSDYLANKDQVADFFGRSFLSVGDFQSKAMEVDGRFGAQNVSWQPRRYWYHLERMKPDSKLLWKRVATW